MHKWWHNTVFYEVYLPSFYDGNGDGIGDFIGLTEKLDYLKKLGIGGIWLTPFYPSPKVDNGYDISDYYSIDPVYGTMEDFERFLEKAHDLGIKVIADLVLNHTSTEHPWFQESRSSKDNPKRDWYIWRAPKNGKEPNNWESFMGGSAWKFDPQTGEYYYHAFSEQQADLNWANPEVKQAMFDVIRFWLEKGIDGFRLDVINHLKVQKNMPDNPVNEKTGEQIHFYDKDQEGIMPVIEEIAALIHEYPDKFIVGEVGSEDLQVLKRYCGTGKLDVVFQFNLGSIPNLDVNEIFQQMKDMEEQYGPDQIPTIFFSSHDMPRHVSRFAVSGHEKEFAKLFAMLILTAKGVPFLYYGEEIGMEDLIIEDIRDMKDVQGMIAYQLAKQKGCDEEEALAIANREGRDKSRSPMQWKNTTYYGFSSKQPWIALPPMKKGCTVQEQLTDPNSILSFYRKLIALRKEHPVFSKGDYSRLEKVDETMIFERTFEDQHVLVCLNFGAEEKELTLHDRWLKEDSFVLSSKREKVERTKDLKILPFEGIIFRR